MLRILDVKHGTQILTFIFPESQISDIEPTTKKRGGGVNCCLTFFVATSLYKKFAYSQRINEFFTSKIVTKLSEKLVGDPGSEILRKNSDPRVKKAQDPRSGLATLIFYDKLNSDSCVLFVTFFSSDQDPAPSPHWFGSLDPDPH